MEASNSQIKLLVYGDSICSHLKLTSVESKPGYTTENMLSDEFGIDFLLLEDEYSYLLFFGGTNDIGHNVCIKEILINISKLLYDKNIKIVCFLTPGLFNYDKQYKEMCRENNLIYDNILSQLDKQYFDGIHLSALGSKFLSEYILKNYI